MSMRARTQNAELATAKNMATDATSIRPRPDDWRIGGWTSRRRGRALSSTRERPSMAVILADEARVFVRKLWLEDERNRRTGETVSDTIEYSSLAMAKKRKRTVGSAKRPVRAVEASSAAARLEDSSPPVGGVRRRDVRPWIYAGFDFAFAILYAFLLTQAPTRHAMHSLLLWATVGSVAVAGAGMIVGGRWGWRLSVAGCVVLLLLTVSLLVMILASASFLSGVYGSMGQGAALIALLAGAVVIELVGLLPAFQLKYLMTRAGRRRFTLEPLRG